MNELLFILLFICVLCNTFFFVSIGLDIKELKSIFNKILENVKVNKDE